jgi:uncharacterized membrane protein YeiH
VPLIFRQTELYVTACVIGLVVYLSLEAFGVNVEWAGTLGMATIAVIRLASIRWNIVLPVMRLTSRD